VECYTRLKPRTVDVENTLAYTFSRIVNLSSLRSNIQKSPTTVRQCRRYYVAPSLQRRYVPHCRGRQEAHARGGPLRKIQNMADSKLPIHPSFMPNFVVVNEEGAYEVHLLTYLPKSRLQVPDSTRFGDLTSLRP
jgi:hypothetical protein